MVMRQRSVFLWSTILLLCTTIVAGYSAVYFYSQAQSYKSNYEKISSDMASLTMSVNLKLDYGNGTVKWFNTTRVPLNSTVLTVTKMNLAIKYSLSDLGAFVATINGVSGDSHHYWGWSYWDMAKKTWVLGPVGSDKWVLHDGDQVSWTYIAF